MKKLSLALTGLLFLASLSVAAPKGKAHSGEIMDSQCAGMGGHDPAGYKMTSTSNAKDCSLACVKMGGKFVLHDAAKKATYQLDDQDKPKDLAGQKVKVTGSYDKPSKTIHVENIAPAS
jgi:hypothetical protein